MKKLCIGSDQSAGFKRRRSFLNVGWVGLALVVGFGGAAVGQTPAPVELGFLWHMHQPIYTRRQNILQTNASNRLSFSIQDVHNQRTGPYTAWPRDAIGKGLNQPNFGRRSRSPTR